MTGTIIGKVWSSYLFCPMRCLICNDGFSEYADISLGDAWNLTKSDKTLGMSLVISRTKVGQSTLDFFIKHNILEYMIIKYYRVLTNTHYAYKLRTRYRWRNLTFGWFMWYFIYIYFLIYLIKYIPSDYFVVIYESIIEVFTGRTS